MKSHSLWHITTENSAILEQELRKEGKDCLMVESLFSLVSLGTERLVATGNIPEDIREVMQVPYMEGSFSLPCKYGYSLVGRVLRGNDAFKGRLVHIMHPHQDITWIDPSSAYIIPDEIPPLRAVLAGNLETAVTAVWDSNISVGDTVLIAGFGLIGALIASLASVIPGVRVFIFEKNEIRRQLALKLGYVPFSASEKAESFDAAFNTTSDENALQFCIDHIGFESQVTEVSFYGTKKISVLLGGNFHTARKKIAVSQVSRIPGNRLNRWDHLRRKQLVFYLLRNSHYDSLVGKVVSFTDSPVLFDSIRSGLINEISVVLKYK